MDVDTEEADYIQRHRLPPKPRPEDWLLEWDVIERSPLGLASNRAVHVAVQQFLVEVAKQLGLGSYVRATAHVLYMRYYLYSDHIVPVTRAELEPGSGRGTSEWTAPAAVPFDPYQMASAAVFLAAKVEECPCSLSKVIYLSVKTRTRNSRTHPGGLEVYEGTERFVEEKQQLLFAERALLRATHFDLRMDHAYRYLGAVRDLLQRSDCIGECPASWWERVYARAWAAVTKSFGTVGCLHFRGRDLAAAAMALEAVDTAAPERVDEAGLEALERWAGWEVLGRPEHPDVKRHPYQILSLENVPLCDYGLGISREEAIEAIRRGVIRRVYEQHT
jgi:hypothetical protein